jgi:hypothetical protein
MLLAIGEFTLERSATSNLLPFRRTGTQPRGTFARLAQGGAAVVRRPRQTSIAHASMLMEP